MAFFSSAIAKSCAEIDREGAQKAQENPKKCRDRILFLVIQVSFPPIAFNREATQNLK
jgi:hypothetical protein